MTSTNSIHTSGGGVLESIGGQWYASDSKRCNWYELAGLLGLSDRFGGFGRAEAQARRAGGQGSSVRGELGRIFGLGVNPSGESVDEKRGEEREP